MLRNLGDMPAKKKTMNNILINCYSCPAIYISEFSTDLMGASNIFDLMFFFTQYGKFTISSWSLLLACSKFLFYQLELRNS